MNTYYYRYADESLPIRLVAKGEQTHPHSQQDVWRSTIHNGQ